MIDIIGKKRHSVGMSNKTLSKLLLEWFDAYGRELPWRVKGGAHPDPYAVLVSEFMLQQTGVKTVIPYFARFMERFPTVSALADATLEEVYLYWQGLGYYTRARSLHTTAGIITNEFNGVFPKTQKEVLKLKGIGPYTAASLLAFAFNFPETVIDGNVIRVICRLYNLTSPAAQISNLIREKAMALTDKERSADYASAIMDLGATICTPKKPNCLLCPWHKQCLARKNGTSESIPVIGKLPKKVKTGSVYLITNKKGEFFIRKRPGKGLLSGLYEFPWEESFKPIFEAKFENTGLEVSHVFTHFKLNLKIYILRKESVPLDGQFVSEKNIANYPFSTLMKKIYEKIRLKN